MTQADDKLRIYFDRLRAIIDERHAEHDFFTCRLEVEKVTRYANVDRPFESIELHMVSGSERGKWAKDSPDVYVHIHIRNPDEFGKYKLGDEFKLSVHPTMEKDS